ncbi:MAG TPA: YncE family protein, partial [Pyrinomonadaceae bacterium]
SVIDTSSNTVIAEIPTATVPFGPGVQIVAITPDGTRAYVTNQIDDRVFVIDTATNTVTTTIPLGTFSFPYGVAVTPDGLQVYVANQGLGTVAIIDPITNTVIGSIPVGSNPTQIAIMPSAPPMTKDDCKNGNFEKFLAPFGPFKNQGQCIKFVNK